MRKLSVITLMGIAIVGGSGLMAVAGETKAQVENVVHGVLVLSTIVV